MVDVARVGIILCRCVKAQSQVQFGRLRALVQGFSEVKTLKELDLMCKEGRDGLKNIIQKEGLDRVVLGACSSAELRSKVKRALCEAGVEENMFVIANLLDLCRWLDSDNLASEKAAGILMQAINKCLLIRPVRREEVSVATKVLVLGGSLTALKAARELSAAGLEVVIVERGKEIGLWPVTEVIGHIEQQILNSLISGVVADNAIEILTQTEVSGCWGGPGNFEVSLVREGEEFSRSVGAIMVALEPEREPNFDLYGLRPFESVISLSDLEKMLASRESGLLSHEGKPKVAFLMGLKGESNTVIMERAIRSALKIQDQEKGQAHLFTRNIKVARDGLEALFQDSRKAGVIYYRFADTTPEIIQAENGTVRITFVDELLSQTFEFTPDITVVDETYHPSKTMSKAAAVLRLNLDSEGFLQSDNIHRFPISSNREGIMVVGSSRRLQNLRDSLTDVENAVSSVKKLLNGGRVMVDTDRVTVHRGKCTLCLTCYRFCPHGAISWTNRVVIRPEACQGCGICASECPMNAVQLENFTDAEVTSEIQAGKLESKLGESAGFIPNVVMFCCQQSAYQAMGLAASLREPLPLGLQIIEIPCAGKVDADYILNAFENGADGVVVMACHEGNCRAEWGSTYASWRVDMTKKLLEEVGLEGKRVAFRTIASNMGREFLSIVSQVETEIMALGPSPLGRQETKTVSV